VRFSPHATVQSRVIAYRYTFCSQSEYPSSENAFSVKYVNPLHVALIFINSKMVELLDAVSRGVDHVSKVLNYILFKTNNSVNLKFQRGRGKH